MHSNVLHDVLRFKSFLHGKTYNKKHSYEIYYRFIKFRPTFFNKNILFLRFFGDVSSFLLMPLLIKVLHKGKAMFCQLYFLQNGLITTLFSIGEEQWCRSVRTNHALTFCARKKKFTDVALRSRQLQQYVTQHQRHVTGRLHCVTRKIRHGVMGYHVISNDVLDMFWLLVFPYRARIFQK